MTDQNEINENNKKFIANFKTLQIEVLTDKNILLVSLNRPKILNALDDTMFYEIGLLFTNMFNLSKSYDIRVVLLKGSGKCFSAGLDLRSEIGQKIVMAGSNTEIDIGRKSFIFYNEVKKLQTALRAIEDCHLPVIALVHGYCLGGAMSITGYCDFTIATKSATFSLREVEIGLVADVGVLQKIQKQSGWGGMNKLLALTGKNFSGEEALKYRIVEEVVDNEESLLKKGMEYAVTIASKSPVAVWGIKRSLNFSRDNNLSVGLEHIATINSALAMSDDLGTSIGAVLSKSKASYPKL